MKTAAIDASLGSAQSADSTVQPPNTTPAATAQPRTELVKIPLNKWSEMVVFPFWRRDPVLNTLQMR